MKFPASWLNTLPRFCQLLGPIEDFIAEYSYDSTDQIVLPSLCNGYIGLDTSEPWLFLDGIFCDEGVRSHRAAIPSPANWLPIVEGEICILVHIQRYTGFDLYTSTFVSRARPHLLVRSVKAVFRDDGPFDIHFKPDKAIDWTSPDLQSTVDEINNLLYYSGEVYTMEDSELLCEKDRVFVITEITPIFNEKGAVLTRTQSSLTYLSTFSRVSRVDALKAFDKAMIIQTSGYSDGLLEENAEAWLNRWSLARVTMVKQSSRRWEENTTEKDDGARSSGSTDDRDFHLSRCLISAQYALLSNFPEYLPDRLIIPSLSGPENSKECAFFGVCPSGLGRGNTEDDYMGHTFWDMDIWMLPWMSLLHPALSQLALNYRYATLHNAELRAKREGYRGARFAWESARTGLETSPWDLSANLEVHVIANVSIAIQNWLFLNVTPNGHAWYENKGRTILNSIAAFWASRLEFSPEKDAYVIKGVMPPDEYCHCCDNSAYTNAAASLALSGPAVVSRLFGQKVSAEQDIWESLSTKIWMPFDEKDGVMLEYEDYKNGTIVKQADTVLLSYPLMYEQSREAKIKMIKKYAAVTSDRGPAMTWAMFFISALEVGLMENAFGYFDRCLLYCKPPFYVWSEQLDDVGAKNFITGLGGFLQAIMNGLVGIRVTTQLAENGQIEPVLYISPKMIGQVSERTHYDEEKSICTSLQVYGLAFAGRRIDIALDGVSRKIKFTLVSGEPLILSEGIERVYKGVLKECVELPLDSTFRLTSPKSF
nr:acid trehalase protein 1 [Hymenolepis microstoma]